MAKLTFEDLATDIKALIVDKITRPTDLKNLCLVNKQLHALAVKPLYLNVCLDLGSAYDSRLSAFLSPRNIGLPHVRQLRLDIANGRDTSAREQQAHVVTRMILEFLPEDVLEEFSWCPWRPFSAENMLLLYRRQRKLKWLEVMDLNRDILPDLKKDDGLTNTIFSTARKLAIYPENRATLRLSQFFIERTAANLEELIIHANFSDALDLSDVPPPHAIDSIEPRELNDSATAPGLLSRTVFEHMMPFDKCVPFGKLTSVRLHRVSLRYCADTWCKFIDFRRIQELRLYHCGGADSLFGQLSKAQHLPERLRALEFQHKDNAESEALVALDGFLCLVSGLRDIIIDLENVTALPGTNGLVRHAKTLELLSIHGSPSHGHARPPEDDVAEHLYSTEDFEKICGSCTHLEQLSTAWPMTSLIRLPVADWRAYETAMSKLRRLATLHISTWPNTTPGTSMFPRPVFETLLQGLAQRMFAISSGTFKSPVREMSSPTGTPFATPPTVGTNAPNVTPSPSSSASTTASTPGKLRLIAFGISDKIYEREDSKAQLLYLRSTALDADGRAVPYAAPIGWCIRQYIEPRSDVLDFVLHRESRLPFREVGSDINPLSGWGIPGVDDDLASDV